MQTAHLLTVHPEQQSLNQQLQAVSQQVLVQHDYQVTESDLYQMLAQQHPAVKPYGSEKNPADSALIKQQQQMLQQAQLLLVQFPIYWFSFPGILHNYWEQLLTPGFAYPGKFKQSPLCDGRTVLLSLTTQSVAEDYTESGVIGSLHSILYPLATMFRFAGYNVLEPHASFAVVNADADYIEQCLSAQRQCVYDTLQQPKLWLSP